MAATRAPPAAFARLQASSAAASTCDNRSPAGPTTDPMLTDTCSASLPFK